MKREIADKIARELYDMVELDTCDIDASGDALCCIGGSLRRLEPEPGKADNNFSQWIVTPKSKGGALPDGYRVKFAAVWRTDQFDENDKLLPGEMPLAMPTEMDFFHFLGIGWIQPADRRAKWRRS